MDPALSLALREDLKTANGQTAKLDWRADQRVYWRGALRAIADVTLRPVKPAV